LKRITLIPLFGFAAFFFAPGGASAQVNLSIFTDKFVNNFHDSSWGGPHGPTTTVAHSGTSSYGCSFVAWEGFSASPGAAMDTTPYTNLSFWAHGGTNGGQRLSVFGSLGGTNLLTTTNLSGLPANAWQQFIIPLAHLGLQNQTNFTRISVQLRNNGTTNTFYLDDLQFTGNPSPALVHLDINTTQTVRRADARWFGFNCLLYDGAFDSPATLAALRESGWTTLRYGGSPANGYHWASNTSFDYTWEWQTSFMDFMQVATNVGGPVMIAVNYGTGTAAEAAGWVRHANITNGFGIRYWEIGNENYGLWEADSNTFPHDAYTYAVRSQDYLAQMRAADPTIRVGVVIAAGEDTGINGYTSHPAANSRNGTVHYGWTPVLLSTLKRLNVTPDFLVYHYYPQDTMGESDPLLLRSATRWAGAAGDLRQQISDYFGPGGNNIELLITENNSNAGDQGKQSTSLVNGLYLADSLGQVMHTEFNAFVWHSLRHSAIWTNGNVDASLYGWRMYGTSGVLGAQTAQTDLNTRYPTFYAAKLLRSFVSEDDSILSATSDYPWLAVYAVRRASGAVNVLVINKDPGLTATAQLALEGFTPGAAATIRSYGIPNDEAARTNGPPAAQDITTDILATAGTNFTRTFPPYSLTLLALVPEAPKLQAVPLTEAPAGAFVIQLQGQPAVRYVIQTATNVAAWTSVSTNTLTRPTLNLTNLIAADSGPRLWRAVWQP